jgi:hypothetical protein
MPLSDFIPRLAVSPPVRSTGFILSCSVATLTLLALARLSLQTAPPRIIRSPRATQLPNISEAEQAVLPYPPDAFPGARDVESPVSHVLLPPTTQQITGTAVWDHQGLRMGCHGGQEGPPGPGDQHAVRSAGRHGARAGREGMPGHALRPLGPRVQRQRGPTARLAAVRQRDADRHHVVAAGLDARGLQPDRVLAGRRHLCGSRELLPGYGAWCGAAGAGRHASAAAYQLEEPRSVFGGSAGEFRCVGCEEAAE